MHHNINDRRKVALRNLLVLQKWANKPEQVLRIVNEIETLNKRINR